MSRPTEQGIPYFPIDVTFDNKTEMYLLEKEADGLAVLVVAWQLIYRNEGYYGEYCDDFFLLIKKRINRDIDVVKRCIDSAILRGIFNKKMFDKYKILTSKAIQKRYFIAAKRKKEVIYNKQFLLVDVSAYKNLKNASNNSKIVDSYTTKEKEDEKEKEDVDVNEEIGDNPEEKTLREKIDLLLIRTIQEQPHFTVVDNLVKEIIQDSKRFTEKTSIELLEDTYRNFFSWDKSKQNHSYAMGVFKGKKNDKYQKVKNNKTKNVRAEEISEFVDFETIKDDFKLPEKPPLNKRLSEEEIVKKAEERKK